MRLIDADELRTVKSIQSADFNSIESIQKWIDNAPTVRLEYVPNYANCESVAMVRVRPQGEWILVKVNLKFIYKCSECGRTIGLTHNETLLDYPFCHCGADMRGEEE